MTTEELRAGVQPILDGLLKKSNGSRVTFRVNLPNDGISVQLPLAEARQDGIPSMLEDGRIKQGVGPPSVWMKKHRRPLIQEDVLKHEARPPQELIEEYGAKAQMIGPLFVGDDIVGWVSVHYSPSPRTWSESDVAALEDAVGKVMALVKDRGPVAMR